MDKEQKINWIKCWLQKFGDRDNEAFNTKILVNETTYELSLQYDYDFDGDKLFPYDWCRTGFKHLKNNRLSDRANEELDDIINQLKSKQFFY